jgi:hypothetical protein
MKRFHSIKMPGMAALIEHLVDSEKKGKRFDCIGSSTIDLDGVMGHKNMSEPNVFGSVSPRLKSLHFGSKGRAPIEDIADSFVVLAEAPLEARQKVDRIVNEFARIGRMIDSGDFEEVDVDTVDD